MYMFDTQEKSDVRKTKKILLSNGKLMGCCVNGRVWIYSCALCAVCADQQLDNRHNLVDITKDKFMEAKGVCERPNGIKYLSAHCSLLVLGSHLEALSQLPKQTGIPCENVDFLTLYGVRCWGACAAVRRSKKPWLIHSMKDIIIDRVPYDSSNSGPRQARAEQRGQPRCQGIRLVILILARVISSLGQVKKCALLFKQDKE